DKCGGTYSSEWFWAKLLRCARVAPEIFEKAYGWVELADLIPAYMSGATANPIRGICAAGHKAMYHPAWGGLPEADFLNALDPRLVELRARMPYTVMASDKQAGTLTEDAATRCGLVAGIPIAVGAFDAHMGAVGSGVRPGVLVKIMGTSTCDILVY